MWALQRARHCTFPGLDLLLDSNVPLGAGLSSSHAIECAVISALNELTGAGLAAEDMVLATQRAENDFVGAPTGIMDQSASLRGSKGHAVFLDCRDQSVQLVPFETEPAGLVLLVIDTKVSHSHADGGYASRRASCELGAEVLGVKALRDVRVEDLEEAAGCWTRSRSGACATSSPRTTACCRRSSCWPRGPGCHRRPAGCQPRLHAGRLRNLLSGTGPGRGHVARQRGDRCADDRRRLRRGGDRADPGRVRRNRCVPPSYSAFAEAGYAAPDIFTVTPAAGAMRIVVAPARPAKGEGPRQMEQAHRRWALFCVKNSDDGGCRLRC